MKFSKLIIGSGILLLLFCYTIVTARSKIETTIKDNMTINGLVERDTMSLWLKKIENWGARLTGSPNHRACIDWIAKEFEALGLVVNRDPHPFSYWDLPPANVHLVVGDKELGISSVYPFSGLTDTNGINAPLKYIEAYKDYESVRGTIAVIKITNHSIPTSILFDLLKELPEGSSFYGKEINNPVISSTLFGPKLNILRNAGALGVIAVWEGMSDGMASGQWLPFTFPFKNIPAVWMAGKDGKLLIEMAKKGEKTRLILNGKINKAVKADNLWTIIEGKNNKEIILVATHTDGTNPVEENGFVGLLSLAKRIVESGKKPERSIVFVAVAGHMRLPEIIKTFNQQAMTVWLNEHPELWNGQNGHPHALAGIVLEHLGAMEWKDDSLGYLPSGMPEVEVTFTTTLVMQNIVTEAWKTRTIPYKAALVTPRSLVHLGEGEPFYEAHIPEITILGTPSYLLAEMTEKGPGITFGRASELVNVDLLQDQIRAVSIALDKLLVLPVDSFGKIKHLGLEVRTRDVFEAAKILRKKNNK